MKVFITGANGKIGKNLSNYLLKKNYFCILNSRKLINIKKKNLLFYKKDILNKNFKLPKCDVVIHTAGNTPEKNENKIKFNRLIDKKIFQLIKDNNKIKKLIFISTAAIYNQNNRGVKVRENSKLFSNSKYSVSKLKSEKLFLKIKSIKVYVIRIPGLLLTGQEDNFISNLVKKIKNLHNFELYNANQLFNNILLIKSLNSFIENLMKKNFNSGTILLGSSNPLSLSKITKTISNYFNIENRINWKINKHKGFYLDIKNAIKNYNFKSLNTKYCILSYLKKNYPKNV